MRFVTPRAAVVAAAAALILSACAGDDGNDAPEDAAAQTAPDEPASEPDVDESDPAQESGEPPTDPDHDDPDHGDPGHDDPDHDDPGHEDPGHDHTTDFGDDEAALTPDNAGETVQLTTGDSMPLRLQSGLAYNVATLDPDIVEVIPVDHFDDPGYAEWLLEATGPGTTEVVASGAGTDELRYEVEVTD